ncbi:MAG TPA: HAMP domain-containing sensor histidine kinase [Solirubrobacterales bacterium]|nr:HAMP domain-containing sensor histidine kinase [Solirubrobacterales bacterium]
MSLAIALTAGLLASAVIAPVYGAEPGLVTGVLVSAIAAVGLALGHWIARAPSQRPLRLRFAAVAALAVGLILATVLAAAELMFVSNHDALMISAIALAAGLVALRASQVASAGVVDEVGEVRDALRAVGGGERDLRVRAKAAAELAELADAANSMIEKLGQEERRRDAADTARRDLVAAISHDLRTPMTALGLMVEAIGDGLVDAETMRGYLARMRTHVAALGAMIDDLFELSRLEAGDLQWSIERVAVAELVADAVAAMQLEAEANGVAVGAERVDPRLAARADAEKLRRVLFNLIQNAIRHTPADGSVTVRAEPAGEWVEIEVADTGRGIPKSERERVFDSFVRGERARSGAGAGLGLAISRAIVEAHHGRIWVADSEVGTRVRFVIPA